VALPAGSIRSGSNEGRNHSTYRIIANNPATGNTWMAARRRYRVRSSGRAFLRLMAWPERLLSILAPESKLLKIKIIKSNEKNLTYN
jgi:hypothetical protein